MLRWSQRARADLKAIHDYIAKDSPYQLRGTSVYIVTVVHRRRAPEPADLRA